MNVTAWFAHSPINLDKLESVLREARVEAVRRVTPALGQGRLFGKDDILMFTVDPRLNTVTPVPLLEGMKQTAPDCNSRHSKSFFVFRDGTLVGWNASLRDLSSIVGEASVPRTGSKKFAPVSESLKFTFGEATTISAQTDTIVLENNSEDIKLPFSYALAQSLKIDTVDGALRPVLGHVKDWQKELALTGHMACSVKQLRMTKAQLLAVYDEVDFGANVQTTPKLFWMPEYQQLRPLYKQVRLHLEIDGRLEVLEDRAETVNEALDYLSGEVHSEANEFLTWVIIWLIGIEIVLALELHKLLGF